MKFVIDSWIHRAGSVLGKKNDGSGKHTHAHFHLILFLYSLSIGFFLFIKLSQKLFLLCIDFFVEVMLGMRDCGEDEFIQLYGEHDENTFRTKNTNNVRNFSLEAKENFSEDCSR